jgi:hypothetical protein
VKSGLRFLSLRLHQGCQIFIGTTYQKVEKYTKLPQNIPNCHKIYQMATKYTKWPKNIPNGQKYTKWPQNIQMTIKYTKWPQNRPNGHKIDQMATK